MSAPPEIFNPTKESEKDDDRFTQEATETLVMGNEDLVKKIFRVSLNKLKEGDGSIRVGYTMANFAALLANLAAQAEKTTNENIKMQRTIARLTKVMLFVSVVLLFISIFQVVLPFFQHPPEIKHQIQKEENNKTLQKENNPVTKPHTVPVGNK